MAEISQLRDQVSKDAKNLQLQSVTGREIELLSKTQQMNLITENTLKSMRNSISRENSNVYLQMDCQVQSAKKREADAIEFEQLVDEEFAKKPIDDGLFNPDRSQDFGSTQIDNFEKLTDYNNFVSYDFSGKFD